MRKGIFGSLFSFFYILGRCCINLGRYVLNIVNILVFLMIFIIMDRE